MKDVVIQTKSLTKVFGRKLTAVDGLDLSIGKGTVYGLIGRNGAGKTTTIRMLAGVMRPTEGQAFILGEEMMQAPAESRTRFAYVSQTQELHRWMCLNDYSRYLAGFYPRWDAEYARDLAKRFDLPWDRSVGTLSGGQIRKAAILLAFAARPKVLLLDEPAAGLDPIARRELVNEIVETIGGSDVSTILFSTHIITDLERVADTVGIMDKGKLVMSETIEDLQANTKRVQVVFDGAPPADFAIPGAVTTKTEGPVVTSVVRLTDDAELDPIRQMEGARVNEFPLGLEESFIELLGSGNISEFREGASQ